jgi:hypothetical protein
MNIISDLNAKLNASPRTIKVLNSCSSPAIGGVEATFYQDLDDKSVYVELIKDGFSTVGLLPERYAEVAQSIDYDPYNSASYTKNSVYLACSALENAIYHQNDRHRNAKAGGCSIGIRFLSYSDY